MFREHPFPTFDAAVAALVADLARALNGRNGACGQAVLAVGGGRTPETVLPLLAQAACDWSRVTVSLTDDRRVPADDPASNEGLVRRLLLLGPAARAGFAALGDPA
ncbi:MAG: 6-phosphogluconolactonase, partial [Alphaproteobacteria bacterium]